MKKILIGFLLIIALVAVSYYNANRTDIRTKQRYQDGYAKGTSEAVVQKARADSIQSAMSQARGQYEDSLKILTLSHSAVVDSLTQTIAAKDKELAKQAERRKLASHKNGDTGKSKSAVTKSGVTHAQILEYYRGKLKALPADLSAYERSIALAEIRDQTARKFAITAKDLQKIREANKLTE